MKQLIFILLSALAAAGSPWDSTITFGTNPAPHIIGNDAVAAIQNAAGGIAPGSGVAVAAGTNIVATTNGTVVTISSTASGSGITLQQATNAAQGVLVWSNSLYQADLGFTPLTPLQTSNSYVAYATNAGAASSATIASELTVQTYTYDGSAGTPVMHAYSSTTGWPTTWDWTANITGQPNFSTNNPALAALYTNNAASLTNLNASALSSGTVPLASLPGTLSTIASANTNGATIGQVLTYQGGSVTFSNAPSGGGGSGGLDVVINTATNDVYYSLPTSSAEFTLIKTNASHTLYLIGNGSTNAVVGDMVWIDGRYLGTNWFLRY